MSNAFGTRRKFWFEYDAYADGFDKDMLARLNTNIDVLLIFAGLFSAMNTAFIVVALTALSANPANETNHLLRLIVLNVSNHTLTENDLTLAFVPGPAAVRQNCTFFASLCCSLLAATGAVLAKQWLQFYERTRQAGPMEQQAVWRTEKFVGAEKWGLRPVVETLATLLLISLGLFFVALIDYLWSVNKTVAVVVLSFAAAGGLLYLIMVVLAAIFPACPFQTGPSAALRRLPRASIRSVDTIINIFNNLQDRIRAAVRPHSLNLKSHSTSVVIRSALFVVLFVVLATVVMFVISLFSLAGAILFLVAAIPILILGVLGIVLWLWFLSPLIEPLNIDSLHAHSAIIMAESASNAETITTVADNIPLISDFKAVRLIARSTAFETLLFHLQKSFQDFQGGNNEIDLTSTLSLARAVAHTMLADPKRTTKALEKCLRDLDRLGKGRSGSMPLELHILLSCIRTMCGLGATRIQAIDRQSMEIREIVQLAIENGSPFQEIVQLAIENCGPFQVIIDWLAPSPAFALLRPAFTLRENWWTRRPIPTAKVILPSPTATLWLHHCTVIAAYNRWDEGVMEGLVQDLSDQFLFEGLKPDTTYLSRVMDALLAILRWYPLWGARNGHPSLDDKANVQSAWTVPRNRPLITQLLDTLDEFSRHYATEDPTTFSTFLRCQQRLLVHVNILYPSYDILIGGGSQSRPEVSLFRQIHASLNSNLGRLLTISGTQQSVAANDPGSTSDLATGCEAEVVRTLHRLLLTWTTQESVNPADLASTTRLALRVRTIAEKEQILQGILYSIFTKVLRSYPSDELVVESRYAHLQKGRAVAVVLASTLRLYV
ncbi:hypothetical protein FRB94_014174 [Tulasnella sp. JGI-2019a]|nr:hypothetical protein FRB94_014174 [Tulasnella sp. JGI-2019a]